MEFKHSTLFGYGVVAGLGFMVANYIWKLGWILIVTSVAAGAPK